MNQTSQPGQASQPGQPGTHWAAIGEVSFVAGMRLLFWVARVLGRWPFRLVLYPVIAWYVLKQGQARRSSQAYLQRVLHCQQQRDPLAAGVKPGWLGVMRHFAAFAEVILDKMLLWGGLFQTDRVRIFGSELIDRSIAAKQGGVLVCSHLGNLELCRVLARQHAELQLTVLVHTKHAQAFNHLLATLDPASQLNLLQVTEITPATAMLLAEKVEQGGFVVIAGDRVPVVPGARMAQAPFLGGTAAFPVGPYILASILQCPIYLIFSLECAAYPEIHFELLRQSVRLPRKEREAALALLVADYAARLEHYCLKAPLQWFNFYDFWQHYHATSRSPATTD